MPTKANFTPEDIRRKTLAILENNKRGAIVQLFYIGEKCLAQARSGHLYYNQTGNLCSSIGYCVLVDGEIAHIGEWKQTSEGRGGEKDGTEGSKQGKTFLQEQIEKQPKEGIVFLMVAGMPYAQYVEAMSLDVLDTSEQMAERKIKDMLNRLFKTTKS